MAEVTVHYDGPVVTRAEARDDLIFDPFVGSGTTIIAAETTGRVFHAI
jgi:tRNA G10  N-methylase Trm11